jgi:hypothetical protein
VSELASEPSGTVSELASEPSGTVSELASVPLTIHDLDALRDLLVRFRAQYMTNVDPSKVDVIELIELVDDLSEAPGAAS